MAHSSKEYQREYMRKYRLTHRHKEPTTRQRLDRIEYILDKYLWWLDTKAKEDWDNYFEEVKTE